MVLKSLLFLEKTHFSKMLILFVYQTTTGLVRKNLVSLMGCVEFVIFFAKYNARLKICIRGYVLITALCMIIGKLLFEMIL